MLTSKAYKSLHLSDTCLKVWWPVWAHLPLWACSGWLECLGTTSCSACQLPQCLRRPGMDSTPFHPTAPAGPEKKKRDLTAWTILLQELKLKYLSLHCRWQWHRLSSTAAETFRSSCHSWLCLRRWRQSQMSQPGRQTRGHLKETRRKRRVNYTSGYTEHLHHNVLDLSPTR